jgi:hypothetical protein
MAFYENRDLLIDDHGDLVIRDGDLVLADPVRSLAQVIIFRLKTSLSDWAQVNASTVADLQEIVGEANTEDLGNRVKQQVELALLSMSPINPREIDVDVVPTNIDELTITVVVSNVDTPDGFVGQLKLYFTVDLLKGEITALDSRRY